MAGSGLSILKKKRKVIKINIDKIKLRVFIARHKLKLVDIARTVGVSKTTLSYWINDGYEYMPTEKNYIRLCKALGVDQKYLLYKE